MRLEGRDFSWGEGPLPLPLLVVGYGNPARRDDGLGIWVVARLAHRFRCRGELLFELSHQLLPEMALRLQEVRSAIFVDAGLELEEPFRLEEVLPSGAEVDFHGELSPSSLLSLCLSAFGRSPRAYLLSIKAVDLSMGFGLSREARSFALEAESLLARLLEGSLGPSSRQSGTEKS